ncbi:CDP-glycerol glycerophosphotransferase family protein OS=Streptomyces tendae OX=1932 GN=GUR47_07435 PE=3 SV=1 [Streptomyces tendae]
MPDGPSDGPRPQRHRPRPATACARTTCPTLLDSLDAHPLTGVEVIVAAVGDSAGRSPSGTPRPSPCCRSRTGPATPRPAWRGRPGRRAGGCASCAPRTGCRWAPRPPSPSTSAACPARWTSCSSTTSAARGGPPDCRPDGPRLTRAGRAEEGLALDDRAALLRLTPLLGNRAVRAPFWRAHERLLTAAEDEPFAAYAALLLADRVACLPHPAYEDRRLRPESLPPPTPAQQYALVDRYEALLGLHRRPDRRPRCPVRPDGPRLPAHLRPCRDAGRRHAGVSSTGRSVTAWRHRPEGLRRRPA